MVVYWVDEVIKWDYMGVMGLYGVAFGSWCSVFFWVLVGGVIGLRPTLFKRG